MGLFNKLFGGSGGVKADTPADQIVRAIREKTTTPCIKMLPVKTECTPYTSKLGGVPYMPVGFSYPTEKLDEENEKPLRFLAQINFKEIPPLAGFPVEGILQFYISEGDLYGLNFEALTVQKGFRIIYHEKVAESADLLLTLPFDEEEEERAFPISEELKLAFERTEMPMGGGDFRFDKMILDAYNEIYPTGKVTSLERISEEIVDGVYDQLGCNGHHIGGYPMFTQIDPREYHEDLREHTILLFQLDSEDGEDYSILWGDSGVCNFFIRPDDLANRDFSTVLYNWDCY